MAFEVLKKCSECGEIVHMHPNKNTCRDCEKAAAESEKFKQLLELTQKNVEERLAILENEVYELKRHTHYNPHQLYS